MRRSAAAVADPIDAVPEPGSHPAMHAFTAELAAAGVRDVCLAPGARSTPLVLAVAAEPRLRRWLHLDERSAAFFALGLAKASRRPVAVLCTSGSAAANLFPAVVEAAYAHVPLLLLTADRPPELRECGAPQAIDQLKLFGDHVKWFCEVGDPAAGVAYTQHLASRAAATARALPAGPVHLNFAFREPLVPPAPVAAHAPAPARTVVREPQRLADGATIDTLAATLAGAARGCIVCGPLDLEPAAAEAIARLGARLGYPVLADATSQLRNGLFDGSGVIDTYDVLLRDARFAAAAQPDLVLRIGPLPISKALTQWLQGPHTIVLDPTGGWNDPLHAASEIIHADVAPFCDALAARTRVDRGRGWLEWWRRAGARARRALTAGLAASDEPFEGRVVAALAELLPNGSTLYVGNSMATRDLELFWPCSDRRVRILCNRGANGIDGFVSSALGAAAAGAGPVVALTGDLGFLYDLTGLLAARRHGLHVVFVVLNNDGGGIFSYLPQADAGPAFRELFVTPHGLDLRGGVEMYGCGFERVGDLRAFGAVLERALADARTSVIEVPIDRERSVARHRALWAAAAAAAGDDR